MMCGSLSQDPDAGSNIPPAKPVFQIQDKSHCTFLGTRERLYGTPRLVSFQFGVPLNRLDKSNLYFPYDRLTVRMFQYVGSVLLTRFSMLILYIGCKLPIRNRPAWELRSILSHSLWSVSEGSPASCSGTYTSIGQDTVVDTYTQKQTHSWLISYRIILELK